MAEFCKKCAGEIWEPGAESDFKGLAGEGNVIAVICEGCGYIHVDNEGVKIETKVEN